jgi:hypothetical protein
VTKSLEFLWKFLAQQRINSKIKFSLGIDACWFDKLDSDVGLLARMSSRALHLDWKEYLAPGCEDLASIVQVELSKFVGYWLASSSSSYICALW